MTVFVSELAAPVVLFAAPPPTIDSLRGVPFVPPMPLYYAGPDPQLHSKIVNQIDYYFRYCFYFGLLIFLNCLFCWLRKLILDNNTSSLLQ